MIITISPKSFNHFKKTHGVFLCFYDFSKDPYNQNLVEKIEKLEKNFCDLSIVKLDWLKYKKYFKFENDKEYNQVVIHGKGEVLLERFKPDSETELPKIFEKCKEFHEMHVRRISQAYKHKLMFDRKSTSSWVIRKSKKSNKYENLDIKNKSRELYDYNIYKTYNLNDADNYLNINSKNNKIIYEKVHLNNDILFGENKIPLESNDICVNIKSSNYNKTHNKKILTEDNLLKLKNQKLMHCEKDPKTCFKSQKCESYNADNLFQQNIYSALFDKKKSKRKLYTPRKILTSESKVFLADKIYIQYKKRKNI